MVFSGRKPTRVCRSGAVREALSVGANVLAVACPYETPRFEDAAKTVQGAAQLKVSDISELLVKAMENERGEI